MTVEATAAWGSFLVSVSDTGSGMSQADQQKIFEEFQQADSSSTRKKGGTGLRLSIARRIIVLRERVRHLAAGWHKRGYDLALGVDIAQGYTTIGAIGFEGRWDYGAIGTVTNLAARLCGEAQAGQILVSSRVAGVLEGLIEFKELGRLTLKGFLKPVPTFNAVGPRTRPS